MPDDYRNQKPNSGHPYADPDRPYSGSGPRYQNNYSKKEEYHKGDAPFQFPWWAIVIGFVTWWPLGLVFLGLNEMIKRGSLGGLNGNFARTGSAAGKPIYAQPEAAAKKKPAAQKSKAAAKNDDDKNKFTIMMIVGCALAAVGLLSLPEAVYWLPDALAEGGTYWHMLLENAVPTLVFLGSGIGCLFGAHKVRTNRRLRKKIDNIVGDAKYMYIQDIADAIPCSYDKCCKHLENCIDKGLFGPDAYLDMRTRCLVVEGRAPAPEPKPAPTPAKPAATAAAKTATDKYQQILDELRRVNDAIPDEEMTDKISRLEAVSAKIFAQAKADPDKLPRMRKFMDYYLPTSLKLLKTYAELDAQGVEGENIRDSKRRIEQTMDTLVQAFENQLDQLFRDDALDVSADIDVMQNMLRADGLTGADPFKLGDVPEAPEAPRLEL